VIRAELPRDGFGASRRDEMERKDAGTRFYSPKAVPRKEGRDLEKRIRFEATTERNPSPAWGGRRCLTGGSAASATHGERQTRQRARAACWASGWIRPKRDAVRARGDKQAAGSGRTAALGRSNAGRGERLGCRAKNKEER
jgi:hypothetical protein